MENHMVFQIIVFIAVSLLAVCVIAIYFLKRQNALLAEQLTKTTNALDKLEKAKAELEHKHGQLVEFQRSMASAELSTSLQQSRPNVASETGVATLPEKYTYIRSLTKKGMKPEEISNVLNISVEEAAQLVSLSEIAQKN